MRDCRPVDIAQPVRWLERSSRRLRVKATNSDGQDSRRKLF